MNATFAVLIVALALECWLLFQGQRKLFFKSVQASGGKYFVGYLLSAPGTMLHETAHYLMGILLRVPVGGQLVDERGKRARVHLFRPQRTQTSDGQVSVTLGSVPVGRTDPLRGALISVAPLLLVPPLLLAVSWAAFGDNVFDDPWQAIKQAPIWATALWLYVAFSAGQAAFPSVGDHIGVFGALALGFVGALAVYVVLNQGGFGALQNTVEFVVLLLLVPAATSALSFVLLTAIEKIAGHRPTRHVKNS